MALVTVFGGTGFLGRHIVEHLARDGAIVRIAVRRPAPARGDQLAPVMADIRDENAVAAAALRGEGLYRTELRDRAAVTRRGPRCPRGDLVLFN